MKATTKLIAQAKKARRISTDAFDDEVERLLNAGLQDLGVAGVTVPEGLDDLVSQAAITYFMANFGESENYDRLKASYDEQKAQMSMKSGYTDWGDQS